MLTEQISHMHSELHTGLALRSLREFPIHCHDELELIYVLHGEINIKSTFYSIHLKKGDLYLINSGDLHCISESRKSPADIQNLVLFLHIDLNHFTNYDYYINKSIFSCSSAEASGDDLIEIENIKRLMAEYYLECRNSPHEISIESTKRLREKTVKILLILGSRFQFVSRINGSLTNNNIFRQNDIQIQRFQRISDYIYDNYTQKVTLEGLAKQEFMSKYYLTRLLKDGIGMGFQELLNLVRVENSEKLLLSTTDSVESIAYSVGFSTPSYFNKNFQNLFGRTPQEHRKIYYDKTILKRKPSFYETDEKSADLFFNQTINTENSVTSMNKAGIPQLLHLDLKKQSGHFNFGTPINTIELSTFDSEFVSTYMIEILNLIKEYRIATVMVSLPSDPKESVHIWAYLETFIRELSHIKNCPALHINGSPGFLLPENIDILSAKYGVKIIVENYATNVSEADVAAHLPSEPDPSTENHFSACLEDRSFASLIAAFLRGEISPDIKNLISPNMKRRKFSIPFFLLCGLGAHISESGDGYLMAKSLNASRLLIYNDEDALGGSEKEYIVTLGQLKENCILKRYTIDEETPWEELLWQTMGQPSVLTAENANFIERAAFPVLKCSQLRKNHEQSRYISLNPGSAVLFVLEKLSSTPLCTSDGA